MVPFLSLMDRLLENLRSILFAQSGSKQFGIVGSFWAPWSRRSTRNKPPFLASYCHHVILPVCDPFDHGRNGKETST